MNRRTFLSASAASAALALTAPKSRANPAKADGLDFATITELAPKIASRELSPVDLTKRMLDRVESYDGHLKSYATVMKKSAMKDARRAEKEIRAGRYRGPLHGVPIAVKDLCFTEGVRTMGGTKALADHVPEYDATVVARLREAGAILLGKLNLTEGAMGGYNPEFDVPVNPWDATRWAGVSSSGSGVATAAGLCYGSLGSDTGGSIRYPSACNGLTGLKPTWGRVSRYGILPLAESMDHVGPMTRSARDAATMFDAIAGYDKNDSTSLSEPPGSTLNRIEEGVNGVRIGVDENYITGNVLPVVQEAVRAALAVLEAQGATLIEVEVPRTDDINGPWNLMCAAEAVAAHRDTYPSRADRYGLWFRSFLEYGASITGAQYAEADQVRARFSGELRALFDTVDLIACPTMSMPPIPVSEEMFYSRFDAIPLMPSIAKMLEFTMPYNFSGSPTITMPCGFTDDGLPLSVQLVGRHLEEHVLLRAGHAYQSATDWHHQHPELDKAM